MFPALGGGVNGIALTIGPEAVVILSERPLLAVSSAPVGGGLAKARAVINLHVRKTTLASTPRGCSLRSPGAPACPSRTSGS
jgi:hypothetical protein